MDLSEIIDRLRDAFSYMISDIPRFAGMFVISAIALGVIVGSAYTPQVALGVRGVSSSIACPQNNSFILPLFTHVTDMAQGVVLIQCAGNEADIPVLVAYYIEITLIIIILVLIGIIVLNLG